MVTEVDPAQTANTIIAEALAKAGVPQQNIQLLPEALPGGPPKESLPNLDGTLKGQVKGQLPEPPLVPPAVTPPPSEVKPGEQQEPPLSKAEIVAAINEASSRFQGTVDRKINQLQLQMQGTVNAFNQFFQTQEDSSIAGLPADEQILKRLERLEKPGQPRIQIQQPIEQQPTQFYQQLANFVDAVGLKIDDKRIDWAPDVTDSRTGFNRFLASIKKSLVEDQTKVIQDLKDNGDKEFQKLRKKAGVDQVSTTGPGGAGLPDLSKMTPMQKIEYGYQVNAELSQVNQ